MNDFKFNRKDVFLSREWFLDKLNISTALTLNELREELNSGQTFMPDEVYQRLLKDWEMRKPNVPCPYAEEYFQEVMHMILSMIKEYRKQQEALRRGDVEEL